MIVATWPVDLQWFSQQMFFYCAIRALLLEVELVLEYDFYIS